jgi:hypothetical protein
MGQRRRAVVGKLGIVITGIKEKGSVTGICGERKVK